MFSVKVFDLIYTLENIDERVSWDVFLMFHSRLKSGIGIVRVQRKLDCSLWKLVPHRFEEQT